MIRLGITGTDTGVGKTVVTCAIAAALRRRGVRVVAMKPIETGVSFDDPGRDGARIARAAQNVPPLSVTAPMVFSRPASPLMAARAENTVVDLATLDAAMHTAERDGDVLLVEGAGGLLVPITPDLSFADLFRRWSLELVVVAANRLGVINHTLLTLQAAAAASLSVRGVVLNSVSPPDAGDSSAADNRSQLTELLASRFPLLGTLIPLPWLTDADDLEHLATRAEESALIAALMPGITRSFVRFKGKR